MSSTQNRNPIGEAIANHGHKTAASLIARQYVSLTASAAMPAGKDTAKINAAAGAVVVSLPAGDDSIIGLPFAAIKTEGSANAVSLAAVGSNTFDDATTSISTTANRGMIAAVWDGTYWRRAYPTASTDGGPATFTTLTAGDGTGSPTVTLDKAETGTADIVMKNAGVIRFVIREAANENLTIRRYNSAGVFQDEISINQSTGVITLPTGAVITTGGLTVSAGGLTVTAGGLALVAGNAVLTAGVRFVGNVPSAVDDAAAAALTPTVPVGGWYHTVGALKQRLA